MKEIHPSELYDKLIDYLIAKAAVYILLIAAVGMGATAGIVKNKNQKAILSGGACAIALLGRATKDWERNKKQTIGEIREISQQGFKSLLSSLMLPASKLSVTIDLNTWKPELFEWDLFNTKPEKYPHLGVVADSGGGKSTTAEWFTTWLDGVHIAFAPHYEPGDFPGLPIFATARKWGKDEDAPASFEEIISAEKGRYTHITYASGFKALYQEMNRRYDLRDKGQKDFPMVNIHLDEFNGFVDSVGFSDEAEVGLAFVFRRLLMEARKVGIRLIVYLQTDSVKDLKLEGRGQARKNLKFVRLSSDALKNIKKLTTKDYPLLDWLKKEMKSGNQYPATVEDNFAWIPNFKRGAETTALLPNNNDLAISDSAQINQSKATPQTPWEQLNEAQQELISFAQQHPNQKLTADFIKQRCRYFKDRKVSPEEMRIFFQSAADIGWGITMGEGNRLSYGWYPDLK